MNMLIFQCHGVYQSTLVLSCYVMILLGFLDKHLGSVMVLWIRAIVILWCSLKYVLEHHASTVVYESYNRLPWYISKYPCIIMMFWTWCYGNVMVFENEP